MAEHECRFPEVVIGERDDDGPLTAGMQVLTPCECGGTPLDEINWYSNTLEATQKALDLLLVSRLMALYHWAPAARRKQIIRYGLRPKMRPTTNASPDWVAPYVCFGDTADWAWALSGAQRGSPSGEWDLWLTRADLLTEPHILPSSETNGIHEVRTEHRVWKRHLSYVGSRVKP